MKRSIISLVALVVFALAGGTARAGQLTIPNSFTAGTTASAAAVNANFAAVKTQVDDNFSKLPRIENDGMTSSSLTITGTSLATDPTTLNTITATAPGNGVILAMWSAWITCSTTELVETRLYVDAVGTDLFNVEGCNASGTEYWGSAAHYVYAVTASTSYTFEMRARDWDGLPNNMSINDSKLTLLFLPLNFSDGTAAAASKLLKTAPAPIENPYEPGGGSSQ